MQGARLNVLVPTRPLDIDDNALPSQTTYHALTDGVLLIRSLLGLTGSALSSGALGPNAQRTPAQIAARINFLDRLLDIDDNGTVDAATDGVLVIRYLMGFRGSELTANALGACPAARACRTTANGVEAYLDALTP